MATSGRYREPPPTVDRPAWAALCDDKRAALHWDSSQTVANVVVNGKATLAVVDTGSYKTIMDIGMARILGLPVKEANNGDCGTYSTPGTGRNNCYAGVVEGEVMLQLADDVRYVIHGMKLINHPNPMVLLGSDVLSTGRGRGQCNYAGTRLAADEKGAARGFLLFECNGEVREEPLVNVPTAMGSHAAGTASVNLVTGPPLGGQCVRGDFGGGVVRHA